MSLGKKRSADWKGKIDGMERPSANLKVMDSLKNFEEGGTMNKYEFMKSIGFRLEPVQADSLKEKAKSLETGDTSDIASFIKDMEGFMCLFKRFIFKEEKENEKKKDAKPNPHQSKKFNDIYIKKQWLISYTKTDFFHWLNGKRIQKQPNKYFIQTLLYLYPSGFFKKSGKEYSAKNIQEDGSFHQANIKTFIEEWNDITRGLKEVANAPEENLKRRSKTALLIAKLSGKQVFPFIRDFIEYSETNDPAVDMWKKQLQSLLKNMESSLEKLRENFLPSQTPGIVLAKASFNYYTVDKKPVDYSTKIQEIEDKISGRPVRGIKSKQYQDSDVWIQSQFYKMIESWIKKNKDEKINEFLSRNGLNEQTDLRTLGLKKTCDLLKFYKSNAKDLFQKDIDQKLSYEEMYKNQKHPLFKPKERSKYDEFMKKTRQIKEEGERINNLKQSYSVNKNSIKELKDKIQELKKQRGKFFQSHAKGYKEIGKNYEKTAKELGQQKAQRRGIEKERVESQLLNYWAVILEESRKHRLLLIHRTRRKEAKKIIERAEKESVKENSIKLHLFSSLTLRALKKLCFGIVPSFREEIKKELPEYKDISGVFSFKNERNEIDEAKLVEFYQKVLKSNYAKKNLDMNFEGLEGNVLNGKFQSENEFQSAMEKHFYRKDIILIDNKIKDELLELDESCVFEITSYDLKGRSKNSANRNHTELWKDFWTEKNKTAGYSVRLNPETSVFYRRKKEDKLKFFKPAPGRENRFAQPEWRLKTTLTLNAGAERMDLSFKRPEDVKGEIIKFNKKFSETLKGKEIYCYGLDRGQKELATLCAVKKDVSGKRSSFVPMPVHRLKDEFYGEKRAVKNMSYFIDSKPDWFEKKEKPVLDLTTAKLIKGKIVENGDILTYLKLKELSAKRELFRLKPEIKDYSVFHSKNEKCLKVKITNRGGEESKPIYHFREEFKKILPIEDIRDRLQTYLDLLRTNGISHNDTMTVEKINHLKKAVTANMTGILAFLHNKKNPGLIVLEENQKHRKNEENIAGQLEWALYRRFQTEGLVPPRLKEPDLLLKPSKKRNKINQNKKESGQIEGFGLIRFIDPHKTSQKCPDCGEEDHDNKRLKEEKKQGWFHCRGCGFDTRKPSPEFQFLDNPDKMAAYNICREGLSSCPEHNVK